MSKGLGWSLGMAAAIACNGCATLLAGGPSHLDVEVQTPSEEVSVVVRGIDNEDEQLHEAASFRTTLDRKTAYAVGASAPGYEPALVVVKNSVHPAYYLNMIPMFAGLGLFIGSAAVAFTSPDPVSVLLIGGGVALAGDLVSLAGALIDQSTKSAWRHEQQAVTLKLEPTPSADASQPAN